MSDTLIRIENLGKKYYLAHRQPQKYIALRDVLVTYAKAWGRSFLGSSSSSLPQPSSSREEFWALKDVSFDIKQGERVGIIGRNGAGKSTLLKILSRITEPTTGRVSIKGRIASLLEVGTGFHPELTGRENIYLNGAILGMSRAEIKKNFEAIVDFAEVERFLDTPVKHYSSGMYVRLAFAVAAHLETEILLVDEVLAVGDAGFQKKCMGKMDEISHKQGRTILFVSHNMPMVASLCDTGVWLEQGQVKDTGAISSLTGKYLNLAQNAISRIEFPLGMYGNDVASLMTASIENQEGASVYEIPITEPFHIKMQYRVMKENVPLNPNFHLYNSNGQCVFVTSDVGCDVDGMAKKEIGTYTATCKIPANFLNDGAYSVGFALSTTSHSTVHFFAQNALNFLILDDMQNTPTRGLYRGILPGAVRPLLSWENKKTQ